MRLLLQNSADGQGMQVSQGLEMEAAGIEQSLAARHLLTRREHRLSDSRHVRED
jgi:hypothetical protein